MRINRHFFALYTLIPKKFKQTVGLLRLEKEFCPSPSSGPLPQKLILLAVLGGEGAPVLPGLFWKWGELSCWACPGGPCSLTHCSPSPGSLPSVGEGWFSDFHRPDRNVSVQSQKFSQEEQNTKSSRPTIKI